MMPQELPLLLLIIAGVLATVFPEKVVGYFKKAAKGFSEGMGTHESYGFTWFIRLMGITTIAFGLYGLLKYYQIF